MPERIYLRPAAFIDTPVGFDGKAARLAGGLQYFSAVEIIRRDGARIEREMLAIDRMEDALDRFGPEARTAWSNLTGHRPPLKVGGRVIRLDQPQIMGILNVTPDSFSDGGRFDTTEDAIAAGHEMTVEGAAIVDVGGESTRPGSKPVWEGDEAARIGPVVKHLATAGAAVSIDTRKAMVMEAALAAGAGMVNDVSALTFDPRAAEVVARAGCPVVLMHHHGAPETMQDNPCYDGPVLLEVYDWLAARIEAAVAAGAGRENIQVDPGIGFGKTVQHNLQIINGLALLHGLGCPVVLGASRKRTIGALSNEAPPERRLAGSIALALKGAEQGAQIIRVHDVPETMQALKVWRGLRDAALALT